MTPSTSTNEPYDDEDHGAPLVVTSLSHLRFLVIEDDISQLKIAKAILVTAGAKDVIAVTGALDAARLLATQKLTFDCIVCDHRLDDITGLALLQRIRCGRNPFVPRDVRFIMMTGYSNESLVRAARALDINGFVLKPATAGNILKAVQLAFSQKVRLKSPRDYAALNLVDA